MLIQVKPISQIPTLNCPHCGSNLEPIDILWQGIHICVKSKCNACKSEIIQDLEVGHAVHSPCQVDLLKGIVFGDEANKKWLGDPLIKSLENPQDQEVNIAVDVNREFQKVIILNCIDELYGHCVLKLLNAQRHLEDNPEYGLIVIVQKFLKWMVPDGVAEVWTVDIPLRKAQLYYSSLDKFICKESNRFEEIYLSEAHSHSRQFDITKFTQVPKHDFSKEEFKITFVWREDRTWCNLVWRRVLRTLKMQYLDLLIQNWRVQKLFKSLQAKIPSASFAIAGLGTKTKFPSWIQDLRVDKFNQETEREMCHIYSESRLLVGVHGSNMLLPSGHAGMTIDLMPNGKEQRWSNFAQDILYQETDPRIASFRYRYVSFETSVTELANIAANMLVKYQEFNLYMNADR